MGEKYKKKPRLRSNRAKLIRALPHALWGASETAKMPTASRSKICYDCRAKANHGLHLCIVHDIYWRIRDDVEGDYLAISLNDPERVSYAAKAEYRTDEARRTVTSFARYLRRNLGITSVQATDSTIANWQARLVAATCTELPPDTLRVLRGEELRAAYKRSVGLKSCMTGAERQPLLDLYVQNPEQVGLLVFQPAKAGPEYRALLWELADGRRMLDRIYPADGSAAYTRLTRWAASEGILMHGALPPKGALPIVTMPKGQCKLYPYLDTFRWGRWEDAGASILSLRPDVPHADEAERRKNWPLYFDGNRMLDMQNMPIPCTKCRKSTDPRQIKPGPDGKGYCQTCLETSYQKCTVCAAQHWYTDMDSLVSWVGSDSARIPVCKTCIKRASKACGHCKEGWVQTDIKDSGNCPWCEQYLASLKAKGQA